MISKFKWTIVLVMVLFVQVSIAQVKTLTGVVSEGGMTLPGVSVIIKGTQEGTQTDLDGKYSLQVKPGDVLEFSFIGMESLTYKVGAAATHNVEMSYGEEMLEEVVVMAYGQVKTKNEVTGNAVAIKGDAVTATPMASADQALQGRVAGLQMSASSGAPGAKQNIRIRGRNSMTATNEPLYVIDGVPMYDADFSGSSSSTSLSLLATINPADIESMTVLKDAGATAVYGARGTNGVILITTKKGKAGVTKFNFSTRVGFQNNAVKGPRLLSSTEKEELFLDGLYNTYGTKYNFDRSGAADFAYANFYGKGNYGSWVDNGRQNHDWSEYVKNADAPLTSINFSATGGGERHNFYASLSHDKIESTVIGSDFRRIGASLSLMQKISDKVDFNTSIKVTNTKQNGTSENGAYFSNPNYTRLVMNPWNPLYNNDGSYYLPNSGYHNVVYTVNNNTKINDVTRVINSNSLSYAITDNLKFTSTLGIDYTMAEYIGYNNPIHGDGRNFQGTADRYVRKNFTYIAQNGLDYKFYLGDSHRFDAKVLVEYQKAKRDFLQGSGQVVLDGFTSLGAAAANKDNAFMYEDDANLGYVGILNYNYQNRFLVDLTGRRESSSKFTDRNGVFYSVGGAWNVHMENWMLEQQTISTLKLRGSYGTNGNSQIGPNKYVQQLDIVTYDGEAGLIPTQLGGPIGWEKQKKLDVGIDLGFFNDRINFGVAYFQSKTSDLLYNRSLSKLSGFSNQMMNMGSLDNRGIEVEFNSQIVRTDDFDLSIGANLGTVRNRITEMPVVDGEQLEVRGSYTANITGHAVGEWYMPEWAGVDPQTGQAMWYNLDGTKTTVYNAEAQSKFHGASALPKYTGGANLDVRYKGLFLNAMLTFAGGHKVYEQYAFKTAGITSVLVTSNASAEMLDRWQKPGDITDVPMAQYAATGGNKNFTRPSTRFLHDGDYVRLRNLTLGYNFNNDITRTLGVDALSMSFIGTNLWTWVKDKGLLYDPEVSPNGMLSVTTPPVKSLVFSVNVKF
ncbi:SusC/RagA family TonB-linked outer membrane protein [Myroides pelagicus]|uniref:SusC/RagA family TonB-linked outer membrane protein n=1 Tax=Myroides pelagicus TaxID=270914 RepID=A0A7K1GIU8_9FLAO|nr:SusC/RagA family TonB-linked outer membrane protein [Myroides pelagicus]MEC4113717.1 SusC/RagA family TonB-linked outer membrane protein [Myroides pelagicus]MTH28825.1 SusC/RagA family TonB-linked outer membrane protein [Myroides pelagicus]